MTRFVKSDQIRIRNTDYYYYIITTIIDFFLLTQEVCFKDNLSRLAIGDRIKSSSGVHHILVLSIDLPW
jgi:hypothetical protein